MNISLRKVEAFRTARNIAGVVSALGFGILLLMTIAQGNRSAERAEENLAATRRIAQAIETQQDTNTRELELVEQTARLLVDCVKPGGECFDQGQKRTGEAVAGIGEQEFDVTVAGLTCYAEGETSREAMTRCILETLPTVKELRERMAGQ